MIYLIRRAPSTSYDLSADNVPYSFVYCNCHSAPRPLVVVTGCMKPLLMAVHALAPGIEPQKIFPIFTYLVAWQVFFHLLPLHVLSWQGICIGFAWLTFFLLLGTEMDNGTDIWGADLRAVAGTRKKRNGFLFMKRIAGKEKKSELEGKKARKKKNFGRNEHSFSKVCIDGGGETAHSVRTMKV